MDKKKKILLSAVLLVIIAILITYFSVPKVNTVDAVASEYENKIEFKGLYFAQEYVIYNGDVNRANLKIKDGEKVPNGYNVYENLNSPEAGIVCAHLDGYENKYDINNITTVDEKTINNIEEEKLKPGIKIINNSEWYICAMVDKNNLFKKRHGYDLLIGNNYYPADIVKIYDKSDNKFVVFKIKYDLEILNLHRNINGYIIESRYNGIVVPEKALVNFNSKEGILIKAHGYAEFRNVIVLFKDKDTAVIAPALTGNKLEEYDEIICNPQGLQDGSKIR